MTEYSLSHLLIGGKCPPSLSRLLTENQYQLKTAKNSTILWDCLQKDCPDLILLPPKLGKTDSYKLCQKIKVNPNTQSIPIFFFAHTLEEIDRERLFAVGGQDYLISPYYEAEVLNRLRTSLKGSPPSVKTDETLSHLQKQYNALLTGIPDLLICMDAQGNYLNILKQGEVTPYDSYKSKPGMNVCDILPSTQAQQCLNEIQTVLKTGKVAIYEQELTIQNQVYYEEVRVVPTEDQEVLVMVRDITQQQKAKLALEESEQRNSAILDAIPDIMFRVNADNIYMGYVRTNVVTDLLPSDFNPIGKHLREFLPPDTYKRHSSAIKKALETGEIVIYEQRHEMDGNVQDEEVRVIRSYKDEVLFMVRDISDRKRAELELRQQALIFNSISDGVIITDLEGKIMDWNWGAEKMFGYPKEEVLGLTTAFLHTPEDAPSLNPQMMESIKTQGFWSGEINFIRKDGKQGVCETSIVPLCDLTGKLLATVGVNHDITERKRTERQLQESEERFRRSFDDAATGMALVAIEGNFLQVNEAFCRIVGYSEEELLALNVLDINEPEDFNREYGYIEQLVAGEISYFHIEKRYIHKQGHFVWVLLSVSLVRDSEGNPVYVIGQAQDINDRKQAEKQLRDSEERFRRSFDDAATGMALVTLEGNFLQVNQAFCRIVGYSAEELTAINVLDLNYPEDMQREYNQVERLLAGEISYFHIEKRYVHKQGYPVWVLLSLSIVRDSEGNPLYVIGQSQDINDRKQAEKQIHQQNQQMQAILQALPDLLFRISADGTILDYSAGRDDELYVPPEEFLGKQVQNILPPNVAEKVYQGLQETLTRNEIISIDYALPLPMGESYFEARCVRLPDSDEIIMTARNISDRILAERHIRESEERFRSAFDDAATGMALVSLEGQWFKVNRTLTEILGYSETELVELSFQDITYPDDLKADLNLMQQVLDGQIRTYQLEKRFFHKSGRVIWGLLNVSLVRDTHGHPLYFVSQLQDIDQLKRTQEQLEGVASNVPGVIYTLTKSLDGLFRFEYISESCHELFEVTPEEIYQDGHNMLQQIHPDDMTTYITKVQQSEETLESFSCEWRQILPSGRFVWVLGNSRPIRRENGETTWHGVVLDITPLKAIHKKLQEAKEAAEAASRAKSTFLANMSHELRSPLNAILGFAQVLSGQDNLTKTQQENLGIIHRSGEHLLGLINDILDLSKIEAGQVKLTPEEFSLQQMLKDIEEMFRLKAQSKNLKWSVQWTEDVPVGVSCDRLKLRQILINLLSNSFKFTHKGRITLEVAVLSASEDQTRLCWMVNDTGVGIAEDELGQLFNPFVQTQAGINTQQGTGLGLAITQRYVELLGGEIQVESQLEKGTTFQFDILVTPVTGPQFEVTEKPRKIIGLAPDQPDYCLLIVDDSLVNRQLLHQIFAPLGFILEEASNGEEAVQCWEKTHPDLIWMDMKMPVMDGYEATRQIRQKQPEDQSIPILALTASAFDDQRYLAIDAGCDDFVTKPFQVSVILGKLEQYLGVRYLYEEDPETETPANEDLEMATPQDINRMPEDWKTAMADAALALDTFTIEELLTQIPPEQGNLKNTLQTYVDNFAYDQILSMLNDE